MTGTDIDVAHFLSRLRGIAAEWESAHEELESLRVVATSADALATATADSGGTLVDLVLATDLSGHGSAAVASAILEATSGAVEQANARRAELVSGSVALAVSGRQRMAGESLRSAVPESWRGTS